MRRWLAGTVAGVVGFSLLSGGCSGDGGKGLKHEAKGEPGRYLSDFDAAWELVRDTHWDTTYNGVDWDAVRAELRPKAEAARTRGETRRIIQDMVGRLHQSHFGLIPEEVERPGDDDGGDSGAVEVSGGDGEGQAEVGMTFREIDGRAVVTAVQPDGPADRAGVRPGWVMTKIRKTDVGGVISGMKEAVGEHESGLYIAQTLNAVLRGESGSTVPVTFLDASDAERVVDITREDPPGQFVKFGNLPPMSTHLESRWLTPEETGDPDARVGYIAFNIFMIPIAPQFERAAYEFRDADGMVIDIRGNPGGVGAMATALSRFFVTQSEHFGTMSMRGAELQFNVEPVVVTSRGERLEPFTGPLAVVQDGLSASTSELFAGGLRVIGRAKTFGSRSAGMALPASMDRLPSGDVLLHAIADYVNSDGTRLEGDGVPADFEVPLRREDLLSGVDAPLREAAHWIVKQSAANASAANN